MTNRRAHTPYLFIAPFLVFFGVFGALAVVMSFGLSFTNWRGVAGGEFVGLDNYLRLVRDPSFLRALAHTAAVWCLTVPVLSLGGLALAWLLRSRLVRMQALLRTLFFLPVFPSLVVTGIIFLLLLDPSYGLPNLALQSLGLGPINIRVDTAVSVPLIAVIVIWRWLGYNMVIHLAGAGELRIFVRIVLPVIRPAMAGLAIWLFLHSWNNLILPLSYLQSNDTFTYPAFLASLKGFHAAQPTHLLIAASVLATIPIMVVFLFAQRRFISGLTAGAVRE